MPFCRYLIAKTRGAEYLVDVSPSFALLRISRGWALTCLKEFLLKFAAKATRRWLFKLKCPFFLVSWCCFFPFFSATMMEWWWMPQQKNTSLKKKLGIPKRPKCPPKQKNCMALGKQENIMDHVSPYHFLKNVPRFDMLPFTCNSAWEWESAKKTFQHACPWKKTYCNFWIFWSFLRKSEVP